MRNAEINENNKRGQCGKGVLHLTRPSIVNPSGAQPGWGGAEHMDCQILSQ